MIKQSKLHTILLMELFHPENNNSQDNTMSNGVQDYGEGSDVPNLDFDSSTITSSSPADINGLNPQAPCFQYDENMTFLDHQIPLYSDEIPMLDQGYPMNHISANDDIRWMLMSLSSRLGRLEEAVLTGHAQMYQFHSRVTDSMNKSVTAMEEFSDTIAKLKKSLMDFMQALIHQTLGGDLDNVGGDLDNAEMQSEAENF